MIALVIGTVLLLLSVTLYTFMSRQYTGMHIIVYGEIAHFLAETGINTTIGSLRESISKNFTNVRDSSEKLRRILLNSESIDNLCINDLLNENWNNDLKQFSAEVDKTAFIEVNVYLRDFKPIETDPNLWCDPKAARGWIVIESTGSYKGFQRKTIVKRETSIINMVPGVMGKFTLYLNEAAAKGEDVFNLIRNDYKGMITDGPKPVILYNHATPEYSMEAGNLADILKEEKETEAWKHRGWIWLKGNKTRLNLCSGAGDLGEIFHFYDVSKPNSFSPIPFATPVENLPDSFFNPINIPWDKSSEQVKITPYRFWHSFILDSFHDRSNRMESEAMYEGKILSNQERRHYGSKSSILHLFGDSRKGYQSRTRVIGPVYAAFARFANLEVKPEEEEVKSFFESFTPKPLYLLRSMPYSNYGNSLDIKEFAERKVGGPLLKTGMLFKDYAQYAMLMSSIVEQPYAESYNSMQEIYDNKPNRFFPSQKKILEADTEGNSVISRNEHIFFQGKPSIESSLTLIKSRVQNSVATNADFWEKYLNDEGELELNSVVSIENSGGEEFLLPPRGMPQPLVVRGGGIILLEKGNLVLRGVSLANSSEILTIAMADEGKIRFDSTQSNQINIIAPKGEVDYGSKFELFGSLCAKSLYADHRFQGGTIRYRAAQDPTKSSYDKFYKLFISNEDSYWK